MPHDVSLRLIATIATSNLLTESPYFMVAFDSPITNTSYFRSYITFFIIFLKESLLKNLPELLRIFCHFNVIDLGTFKMDNPHSLKYTLICFTKTIEDIKEFS